MDDLKINRHLTIPSQELRLAFSRSGGPGGQHVNKTETRVEVRWTPSTSQVLRAEQRALLLSQLASRLTLEGELVVTSERTRSQNQNRVDALGKLTELIQAALCRPKRRRPTKPSRGSVERRLQAKRARSQVKQRRSDGND